ncbi:hypothetical protein PF010_g28830 [Phytophthora fragariae]|uniref:Secreted protein n=1 Tax=Phytophthora fragariae TaxID=53985 RepID=A0A6G0JPU8_9STRA|nr:hypothetical protein PF010_g28830 [Phytophthora fragariae]
MSAAIAAWSGLVVSLGRSQPTTSSTYDAAAAGCCKMGCQASAKISALSCTVRGGAPGTGSSLRTRLSENLLDMRWNSALVVFPVQCVFARKRLCSRLVARCCLQSAIARRSLASFVGPTVSSSVSASKSSVIPSTVSGVPGCSAARRCCCRTNRVSFCLSVLRSAQRRFLTHGRVRRATDALNFSYRPAAATASISCVRSCCVKSSKSFVIIVFTASAA